MSDSIYHEFTPVSKAEWLQQLAKDLKGKSLEDLRWSLSEDISVDPFYHPDDFEGEPDFIALAASKAANSWEIGEYIPVPDMAKANRDALEGLLSGVQAPLFQLHHQPGPAELGLLLEGIRPDLVSLHFEQDHPGKNPEQLLFDFAHWVQSQGIDTDHVTGTLDFDPLLDWSEPPYDMLTRVLAFCESEMPRFRPLQIDVRPFHDRPMHVVDELTFALAKGAECLSALSDKGLSVREINNHLHISIAINTSFFVAIAKLRALKLVWANLLGAYGHADASLPPVIVHFAPETQTADANTNMIRAATQAMSAVIGGAHTLFVLPSDAATVDESSAFSRRIARNVQHLLKMESYLDRVVDPAAGSFYIEKLTQLLAQNAWAKFQEIERKGGFMQIVDL